MDFKTDIAKKYNRKSYTLSDSQYRAKCKRLRLKPSR